MDFFNQDQETDQTTQPIEPVAPTKVTVGDKEYTQDELSQLVGLGETAKEYETKWNRKVSDFYPDYTQKSQRLSELERREQEREQVELKAKQESGDLSPEDERRLVVEQAKKFGLVTQDEFEIKVNERVNNFFAGKQLLDDTKVAVTEANTKYGIKASVDSVVNHMTEYGFRKPDKAIKDMFESEIDKWKEAQINGLKPTNMVTQDGSTAGAKVPPEPTFVTKDTLGAAIQASLNRNRGV